MPDFLQTERLDKPDGTMPHESPDILAAHQWDMFPEFLPVQLNQQPAML